MNAEQEVGIQQRKRRRFADPSQWQRNVRKKNRATGQSYTDAGGTVRPQKVVVNKKDCSLCKFKCPEKISAAQRQVLMDQYYKFGNIARQKDFICGLVAETFVARKIKRDAASGVDKNVSRKYYLPDSDGEHNRVCLPFFCGTFGISKRIIDDTLAHSNETGVYIGRDKRKGRPASNATPDSQVKKIKKFLAEFPKVPSHYCRKRSSRLYLAPDLSITKLYELYCMQVKEKGPVSEAVFR